MQMTVLDCLSCHLSSVDAYVESSDFMVDCQHTYPSLVQELVASIQLGPTEIEVRRLVPFRDYQCMMRRNWESVPNSVR